MEDVVSSVSTNLVLMNADVVLDTNFSLMEQHAQVNLLSFFKLKLDHFDTIF